MWWQIPFIYYLIDLQRNRVETNFHCVKHTYDLELLFEYAFSIKRNFINVRHNTRSNLEPNINVIILYQQYAEINMHAKCVWVHSNVIASTENRF